MPHYEYDKDYPFAAFITNLGKYNEGDLVGEWVKFPTTPEEMQKVFERIGIGQKDDFGQPYCSNLRDHRAGYFVMVQAQIPVA